MTDDSLATPTIQAQKLHEASAAAWTTCQTLSTEADHLVDSFRGLQQEPSPLDYARVLDAAKTRLRIVVHAVLDVALQLGRAEALAEILHRER